MAIQQLETPHLQIVRRLLRRLAALLPVLMTLLAAGCEKESDEEWTPSVLELSQQTVLLSNAAGAAATVDVQADGDWVLDAEDGDFDITPRSGSAGRTSVTIVAAEENTLKQRLRLGTVRFSLCAAPETACELEVAQRSATASHTLLLYMPGVQLRSYYLNNIAGIEAAVSASMPGDGRILVYYHSERRHDRAELQEIRYDPEKQACVRETLAKYENFNAADPETLGRMFADLGALAPAERYGLVIGCHGKAWVPASAGVLTSYAAGLRERDEALWTPAPGALPTRSFGDPGYELDIAQLAAAAAAQEYRFSYLIFDACFMANIETLYDLRNAFDSIIASPTEIMAAGFPYERTMPLLFADEGAACDLEGVCRAFWNFYMNDWNTVSGNARSGCISLTVTNQLEPLAAVMSEVHTLAPAAFEPDELQVYEGFRTGRHLFFDLGHYVETICTDADLLNRFFEQLERTFPQACRLSTPEFYSAYNNSMNPLTRYSGVSISEPSVRYVDENRRTAWYLATH